MYNKEFFMTIVDRELELARGELQSVEETTLITKHFRDICRGVFPAHVEDYALVVGISYMDSAILSVAPLQVPRSRQWLMLYKWRYAVKEMIAAKKAYESVCSALGMYVRLPPNTWKNYLFELCSASNLGWEGGPFLYFQELPKELISTLTVQFEDKAQDIELSYTQMYAQSELLKYQPSLPKAIEWSNECKCLSPNCKCILCALFAGRTFPEDEEEWARSCACANAWVVPDIGPSEFDFEFQSGDSLKKMKNVENTKTEPKYKKNKNRDKIIAQVMSDLSKRKRDCAISKQRDRKQGKYEFQADFLDKMKTIKLGMEEKDLLREAISVGKSIKEASDSWEGNFREAVQKVDHLSPEFLETVSAIKTNIADVAKPLADILTTGDKIANWSVQFMKVAGITITIGSAALAIVKMITGGGSYTPMAFAALIFVIDQAMGNGLLVEFKLPPSITRALSTFKNTFSEWVSNLSDKGIFQADDGPTELFVNTAAHTSLVTLVLATLSHFIMGRAVSKTDSVVFLSSLGHWHKSSGAFAEIGSYMISLLNKGISFIREKVLGLEPLQIIVDGFPAVQAWARKVDALQREKNLGKLKPTMDTAYRIVTLQYDARRLKTMHLPGPRAAGVRSLISERERVLQGFLDKMSNITGKGAGPRVEPHALLITGAPGIGKTMMTTYMVQETLMQVLDKENREKYERGEWQDYHYNRISSHEYWDNYTGQLVAIFDDLGQFEEPPGMKDSEAQDIVRGVSGFPYAVHRAELENKGNSYFTSELVIGTGNGFYEPSNMKDKDAYRRRLKWFKVSVKKEYIKGYKHTSQVGRDYDANKMRDGAIPDIDWQKVLSELIDPEDDFNPNIYEFEHRNSFTQRTDTVILYKEPGPDGVYALCLKRDEHDETCRCGVEKETSVLSLQEVAQYNAQQMKINRQRAARYKNQLSRHRTGLNAEQTRIEELLQVLRGQKEEIAKTSENNKIFKNRVGFQGGDTDDEFFEAQQEVDPITGKNMKEVLAALDFRLSPEYEKVGMVPLDWDEIVNDEELTNSRFPPEFLQLILHFLYVGGPSRELFDERDMHEWSKDIVKWGVFRYWYKAMQKRYPSSQADFAAECLCFWNQPTISAWVEYLDAKEPVFQTELESRYEKIRKELEAAMQNPWIRPAAIIVAAMAMAGVGYGIYKYFSSEKVKAVEPEAMYGREAKVRQVHRRHVPRVDLQGGDEPCYMNQNSEEIADRVSLEHQYEVCVNTGEEGCFRSPGYGLFLAQNVFVFPRHYLDFVRKYYEKGLIRSMFLYNSTCDHEPILQITPELLLNARVFGEEDLAFVVVPGQVTKKSITKHFMTLRELCDYRPGMVMLRQVNNEHSRLVSAYGSCARLSHPVRPETNGLECPIVDRPFQYTIPTRVGDCGSVLYNYESKPRGRIMGIHFAGSLGRGLAVPMWREQVEQWVASMLAVVQGAMLPKYFRSDLDRSVDFEPISEIPYEGTSFVPFGKAKLPCGYSSWSQFKRSPLSGTYAASKKALAHLRRYTNQQGLDVDPFLENIKKYGTEVAEVNTEVVTVAAQVVAARIFVADNGFAKPVVWDVMQAVLGIPGHQFSKSIPRQTSAGYPYSAVSSKGGKKDFFGDGVEFEFTSPEWHALKATVEDMWQVLQTPEGKDLLIIFSDNLKDETLPREKVDRKTRIFTGVPLDFYLIQRMAFGAFVEMLCEGRIYSGSCVGINVYSEEWDALHYEILRPGKHVVAGDFSGFDASQVYEIFDIILTHIIQPYYNDGEAMFQVRKNIIWIIAHSYHIRGDVVYQWSKNMPSGNYLTAILNTLYCLVLLCGCYLVLHPSEDLYVAAEEYDSDVSAVSYGDDNVVGISDRAVSWFNQQTIALAMTQFGMVYTPETKPSKDEVVIFTSRSITEVSFLKRKWRYEPYVDKIVAPLELSVILEIPMWTKRTFEAKKIVEDNVRVAIEELSYHPEDVFNMWAPRILKASAEHIGFVPPLQSWEANLRLMELRADA